MGALTVVATARGHATQSALARGMVGECRAAAVAANLDTIEARNEWILEAAGRWPLATIGRVFGIRRQTVWEIVGRGR